MRLCLRIWMIQGWRWSALHCTRLGPGDSLLGYNNLEQNDMERILHAWQAQGQVLTHSYWLHPHNTNMKQALWVTLLYRRGH